MKAQRHPEASTPALIPLPVGVDLIRFEKNLLQMGFFGAHDTRHTTQSTRRIEQTVNRDGQKIKVSAEFRSSQDLGLPSTSDRDKYIGFMRIAMEQRLKHGVLENPVKFTGYHLLKELGLSFSGENYEDINKWGQRMANTTITSERVIYMAARKKYANKTVHVFRSFTRAGQSNLDGTGRLEAFEVVLEDWLLENLNQSYVVPEDVNAYRKLKRPTAKGIFGNLHLWFHASQGKPIEKNYAELCVLLNIPSYKHLSKIRETMGRSLDDLGSIGYLSKWDIRPMMTRNGYKLVLSPGEEVLKVLAISHRKQIKAEGNESEEDAWTASQEEAVNELVAFGISNMKAKELARAYPADQVIDFVEYASYLIKQDKSHKIQNPAGFVIYLLTGGITIPSDFVTSRKRKQAAVEQQLLSLQNEYEAMINKEIEREITERFPGKLLHDKVKEILGQRSPADQEFDRMFPVQSFRIAKDLIGMELKESLSLPNFEDWHLSQLQPGLF